MAPRTSDSGILESLSHNVSEIFDQAQGSAASYRKNCIALHKLHIRAASITQAVNKDESLKLTGECCFGDAFLDMVNRILTIKKGPIVADRVVKFIWGYVKHMNEEVLQRNSALAPVASTSCADDGDDDTVASRFVARLLKWLMRGFLSKNKIVRFRAVSIVSEMVYHLGEIDEDMYAALGSALAERASDMESAVRLCAVVALSKLVSSEDPNDLEQSITEIVLNSLCLDPAAEVRRAALLHIPLTPLTLPTILSRGRDVDPVVRKLLYSSVLLNKLKHPKHLTITQREQVVKDGLGDRQESVRAAAGKVVEAWFNVIVSDSGEDASIVDGVVRFLQIFDVVGPGEGVGADALLSVFARRKDVLDDILFDDSFWSGLTPESSLLARVFVDHCLTTNDEGRLDVASLPAVIAFAFHIQETYNGLLELTQENKALEAAAEEDVDEGERDRLDEEIAKAEYVLRELLRIALHLDYTDEIGRRKSFAVVRDMLAQEQLPESLTRLCLDVMKEILPNERELIRVVVEIVREVRDREDIEGSPTDVQQSQDDSRSKLTQSRETRLGRTKRREDMTLKERARVDVLDMRCLILCIGVLERINGNFEENSTLEGILADLIIPAVKRKEFVMREKGLVSLGLCCLIAKNMALSSFQLFLSQVQTSPDELKLKVLQVVFDLLMVYGEEFFGRSEQIVERVITFLLRTLETEESKVVQAVLCIGISKLLLCGFVADERVLTSLLMAYVSPVTADNQELRQCLSLFFPAYCYASPGNQSQMQSIFIPAYDLVTSVYHELEEDQEMITPYEFGLLLIDWTNPQKAVEEHSADNFAPESHVDVAVCILRSLYEPERDDEDRKTLCQLLEHLYVPDHLLPRSLLQLKILLSHLQEQCPFDDVSTDKIMTRFKNHLWKKFSLHEENIVEERYINDADIRELYQFIGILAPERTDIANIDDTHPTYGHGTREGLGTTAGSTNDTVEPTTPSRSDDNGHPSSPSYIPQRTDVKISARSRPMGSTCSTRIGNDSKDKENEQTTVSKSVKKASKHLPSLRSVSLLDLPLANK